MDAIINWLNDKLYTYILIILLIGGGLFFTIRSKFAQFRLMKQGFKNLMEKPKDKKGVSSFQALMVSTASRVGTGNIIGVALALCVGGFGSVFWMWIIALIGGASALIESTLSQIYKKKGKDGCYGGPAYYIEQGLKSRPLAIVFSVLLVLTYGVGFNMLASYNMQDSLSNFGFYNTKVTPWIMGAIFAVLVGFCLLGGGKRIVKATSVLVPIMGLAYLLLAIVVMCINIKAIPSVFVQIFTEAFDFNAIFGGFTGSCVMHGIRRGLFSNEAGVGSAPNASASAEVSHPVKQGLVQVLSVFIDTIIVCTATAFMCMTSGVNPASATVDGKASGAKYVQMCISATLGDFGLVFVAVAILLFGFTTLLGNLYYVDKAIIHICKKEPKKWIKNVYYIGFSVLIFIGAGLSADLLWNTADVFMGAMALINVPVIIILGKYAFRAIKDYSKKVKKGGEIGFLASDISLPDKVDYWQEEANV